MITSPSFVVYAGGMLQYDPQLKVIHWRNRHTLFCGSICFLKPQQLGKELIFRGAVCCIRIKQGIVVLKLSQLSEQHISRSSLHLQKYC